MKNTLRTLIVTFCFLTFNAALAQAQSSCPSTPDVTLFDGQSMEWGALPISDCEFSNREIFIALPPTKPFVLTNKWLKRIEEKSFQKYEPPFEMHIKGSSLTLYRINLNDKTISVVLAQDLTVLKARSYFTSKSQYDERDYNKFFSVQPASPGINYQTVSGKKRNLFIKIGASVGPAFSLNRGFFPETAVPPSFGIRSNLKLLIKFN